MSGEDGRTSIGIIGAGALGSNLARALAQRGLSAVISNSRGPESLSGLVRELGPTITAGTAAEAARCDVVVLAVPWLALPRALEGLPPWDGRIVVDATNPLAVVDPGSPEAADPDDPLAASGVRAIDTGGLPSSEVVRYLVPGARLVKAFNHFAVERLPDPEVGGGRRVMFLSGDDASAKAEVGHLIERLGLHPVDLGSLAVGGPLAAAPFGPLAMSELVRL